MKDLRGSTLSDIARRYIVREKVSEKGESKSTDIATADLIDDSDKIIEIDNGDAIIGGARIEDVMDDGCFVNGTAGFGGGGDFVVKNNDCSGLSKVTVSGPTSFLQKKRLKILFET